VNHIDGDKTNCHPDNLEWVTHAENMRHAYETGLMAAPAPPFGEDHHKAQLTEHDVLEIRRLWAEGWSDGMLSRRFSVSRSACRSAAIGQSWKHLPGARLPRRDKAAHAPTMEGSQ
jgi:hypothetical protein